MICETDGKEINHPETIWNHMFHNFIFEIIRTLILKIKPSNNKSYHSSMIIF